MWGLWPVRSLYRRWSVHGREALVGKPTKSRYSFEFKLDVVRKVVDEGATAEQLAASTSCPQISWSGRGCGPIAGMARTG